MVKNPPASAGDTGSTAGSGKCPEGKNTNPLQYSCLGNPKDRGAWWATVHGVAESDRAEPMHTHWGSNGSPRSLLLHSGVCLLWLSPEVRAEPVRSCKEPQNCAVFQIVPSVFRNRFSALFSNFKVCF